MLRKIIIPKWKTLESEKLLSIVQGKVCIRKIVYANYLKRKNPGEEKFIDSILEKWSSHLCLTEGAYQQFRESIKRLRKFSDEGIQLILEGEEEDDDV